MAANVRVRRLVIYSNIVSTTKCWIVTVTIIGGVRAPYNRQFLRVEAVGVVQCKKERFGIFPIAT